MRNNSNFTDIYVNQVQVRNCSSLFTLLKLQDFLLQLPPSQSQILEQIATTTAQIQVIENRHYPCSFNLGQPPTYNEAIQAPNIERKIQEILFW